LISSTGFDRGRSDNPNVVQEPLWLPHFDDAESDMFLAHDAGKGQVAPRMAALRSAKNRDFFGAGMPIQRLSR